MISAHEIRLGQNQYRGGGYEVTVLPMGKINVAYSKPAIKKTRYWAYYTANAVFNFSCGKASGKSFPIIVFTGEDLAAIHEATSLAPVITYIEGRIPILMRRIRSGSFILCEEKLHNARTQSQRNENVTQIHEKDGMKGWGNIIRVRDRRYRSTITVRVSDDGKKTMVDTNDWKRQKSLVDVRKPEFLNWNPQRLSLGMECMSDTIEEFWVRGLPDIKFRHIPLKAIRKLEKITT